MRTAIWSAVAVLAMAACSGGGDGPTGNGNTPAVAGTYDATFTATQATGCQDLIMAPSSTSGQLTVTQSGSSVTLHIANLHPAIASNAVGTLSTAGAFHFGPGSVLIDSDENDPNNQLFEATGTFDGTFSGTSMNIAFNFTLATCTVAGTIVGQRS